MNSNKSAVWAAVILLIGVGIFAALNLGLFLNLNDTSGVAAETQGETPINIDTENVSINLHTQRTTVEHDETVSLIHSVTNFITNEENLTVQLILEAPQGSNIFAAGGAEEGSGSQFTTITTLKPGEQENIRIHADINELGEHQITGQAIYFLGDNQKTGDGVEVTIPIKQKSEPPTTTEQVINAPIYLYNTIADTAPSGEFEAESAGGGENSLSLRVSYSAIISTILISSYIGLLIMYLASKNSHNYTSLEWFSYWSLVTIFIFMFSAGGLGYLLTIMELDMFFYSITLTILPFTLFYFGKVVLK